MEEFQHLDALAGRYLRLRDDIRQLKREVDDEAWKLFLCGATYYRLAKILKSPVGSIKKVIAPRNTPLAEIDMPVSMAIIDDSKAREKKAKRTHGTVVEVATEEVMRRYMYPLPLQSWGIRAQGGTISPKDFLETNWVIIDGQVFSVVRSNANILHYATYAGSVLPLSKIKILKTETMDIIRRPVW